MQTETLTTKKKAKNKLLKPNNKQNQLPTADEKKGQKRKRKKGAKKCNVWQRHSIKKNVALALQGKKRSKKKIIFNWFLKVF